MAALALPVIAIAVLIPLAACDVSQRPHTKTVRTGSTSVSAMPQQGSSPGVPGIGSPAPAEPHGGAAMGTEVGGERSLRLYGPGVSRKKQTRV
jgi:hypothetical protein